MDAFVSFSFQKSSSQSEVMKLLGEILLLTRSPFVGSPPESSPPSTGAALYRNASSVRHQWQRHYPWQYRSLYRSETSQGVTHWSAWPVLIYAAYDTSSWPRLETTREPRIFRQHKDTSEISVSSQESLRGSCYPTAEDRARNLLIDVVEWVHRAFHPSLVDLQVDIFVSIPSRTDSPSHVVMAIKQAHLCDKSPHSILSLRRAGIVRNQSALPG